MRLGSMDLDQPPILVAVFGDEPRPALVTEARAAGMDVAEIRVDLFASPTEPHVHAALQKLEGVPVIATLRSRGEGGGWPGSEAERLQLFRSVLPRVDAVDVELESVEIRDAVVTAAHKEGKVAIVSFHDFNRTPALPQLRDIVSRACQADADLVKVAARAHSDADVRTLAQLLVENEARRLVVIAMGPTGAISRIFFPALGSRLTFASLERSTAPGQMPLRDTMAALRAFYPRYDERKRRELDRRDGHAL